MNNIDKMDEGDGGSGSEKKEIDLHASEISNKAPDERTDITPVSGTSEGANSDRTMAENERTTQSNGSLKKDASYDISRVSSCPMSVQSSSDDGDCSDDESDTPASRRTDSDERRVSTIDKRRSSRDALRNHRNEGRTRKKESRSQSGDRHRSRSCDRMTRRDEEDLSGNEGRRSQSGDRCRSRSCERSRAQLRDLSPKEERRSKSRERHSRSIERQSRSGLSRSKSNERRSRSCDRRSRSSERSPRSSDRRSRSSERSPRSSERRSRSINGLPHSSDGRPHSKERPASRDNYRRSSSGKCVRVPPQGADSTKENSADSGSSGEAPVQEKSKGCGSGLASCSNFIIQHMELFFASHGRRVARHPVLTIVLSLLLSALAGIGLINFDTELRPFKLWLPQNSDFIRMLEWQNDHFPTNFRRHLVLWEAPNVLTADSIQEMWRVHEKVIAAVEPISGKTWTDVCARIPSLNVDNEEDPSEEEWELGTLEFRRKKRGLREDLLDDISFALSRKSYCDILIDMPSFCYETGLLEIWGWDNDIIMNLNDSQIIKDVNHAKLSEVFGIKIDFKSYLGNIVHDEDGMIISAESATQTWISEIDEDAVENGDFLVDLSSGQLVDSAGMAWEDVWLETVLDTESRKEDVVAFANAASSFGKVSDDNIWGDVTYLTAGFVLMFAFVNLTLGRRNKVEQRPILSLLGTLSVSLAILSSYGICSALQIKFTPVNSILPLLLIGLGVDDMFIIVSMWDNDTEKRKKKRESQNSGESVAEDDDLVEKAGRTMQLAGVAITATSLTDVTAFAIGATTELPALRSFCLYASFGILIVFLLQCTFFLAFLVIDEKRLRENRNGLLWFIVHENWEPSDCSRVDVLNRMFAFYGNLIVQNAMRYCVLIMTAALVIVSIIGSTNLQQEFNPTWFIPTDSYLAQYFEAKKLYFSDEGAQSFLFFANDSLTKNLPDLIEFNEELVLANSVVDVHAWFDLFKSYVQLNGEFSNRMFTDSLFSEAISLFIYTPTGGAYRSDVVFDGETSCNASAPPIQYFRIPFKHRPAETPFLQQQATSEIRALLDKFSIPGFQGTWSEAYSIWETNTVVGDELLRNMILAALVITALTVVLLVSLRAAILVLCCVSCTVVGVSASMHLFGLTIDTVSCISLVLSIGLSVDYSVHIAHSFLSERGSEDKRERVVLALTAVGPAVLQGGLSTLIPFLMLAFSNSHVFRTFFAVFTPTTILGLYYALIVLPVLLSFVGPEPYESKETSTAVATDGHVNNAFTMTLYDGVNSKENGDSSVLFY